jgi:hypothetical protein
LPSQHQRFKEMAKQLECDPSQEKFKSCLKQIARHQPPLPKSK